jgi:hypothetical protein
VNYKSNIGLIDTHPKAIVATTTSTSSNKKICQVWALVLASVSALGTADIPLTCKNLCNSTFYG